MKIAVLVIFFSALFVFNSHGLLGSLSLEAEEVIPIERHMNPQDVQRLSKTIHAKDLQHLKCHDAQCEHSWFAHCRQLFQIVWDSFTTAS